MTCRLRPWLAVTILAIGLGACAPAPTATSSTRPESNIPAPPAPASIAPSAPVTVADGANGISFERPAGWTRWQPNEHAPWNDGALVYLGTDPLFSSCATAPNASPNPPDELGYACDWPLRSLSSNGVLVTWLTTRILQPLPTTGENALVNGGATRLQIERPGGCAAIGADETISTRIPIGHPGPWSNTAVVACLRGPDLATAEAEVRAMLASAAVGH